MTKDKLEQNLVLKLCFDFSISIISFSELLETQKRFVVARQLLKSGTSIGANAFEAQSAEARQTSPTNFELSPKKQRKLIAGSCFAITLKTILTPKTF
jgi:hypothetical protein